MTEEIKPKKKKPSLTAQIKKLKAENKRLEEIQWKNWRRMDKLRDEIKVLRNLCPLKYYKVEYSAFNKDKTCRVGGTKITESYTLESAVEKAQENLYHPDSFEIVNITVWKD